MHPLKTLSLALSLCTAPAWADDALVGTWRSVTAEQGAVSGTLALRKDHTVTLSPKGYPAITGTWASPKAGLLAFTVAEAGTSEMSYDVKPNRLVLTYDNGSKQEFSRARKGNKSPTKPPAVRPGSKAAPSIESEK